MTPLELAWEEYGGELLGNHGKVKAKCPLHEDGTASARVNIEEQKWRCFAGCGFGDIYELIKLHSEQTGGGALTFPEQKAIAMRLFGANGAGRPAPKKRPARKGTWRPPWLK